MENVELGNLGTISVEQAITAIYIGYYNRAPDPVGLAFHVSTFGQPTAGGDGVFGLDDIATDFSTQAETAAVHSFFSDPSATSALAFLNSVYLNLFGREADQEGIDYWVPILEAAVAGEDGAISVGETILQIIQGAQNTDAGQDLVRIQNKIDVSLDYASTASGVADLDYENNADAQAAAKDALAGVTDEAASVVEAKAEIAAFFDPILNPSVPGETKSFTGGTDNLVGTDNDDQFDGYLAQSELTGGVSNSLSSADSADGGAGDDTMYAVLGTQFFGATSAGVISDVQPRLTSIETIELEALDLGNNAGVSVNINNGDIIVDNSNTGGNVDNSGDVDDDINNDISDNDQQIDSVGNFNAVFIDGEAFENAFTPIASFDGKDTFGMNTIGSVNSDGDLLIENINTKVNKDDAVGRKTADITITMDHTDNFNSDGDAADLAVYFDENYLLANDPLQAGAQLTIELMDLDAETIGEDPLLDNPFGKITFNFGDTPKELDYGTNSNTYAELLADIQAAIDLAAQTDPDFSQLSASFGPTFTVRDTDNDPNPARPPLDGTTIVITNSGPEVLEAVTMQATGTQPAGKDFHTGFDNEAPEEENFKVEVDIDLHKVGRGGEGGDLIVGGKSQREIGDGINVFNVDVLGAGDSDDSSVAPKPSNMGTLTSTNGALETVNIETHADYVDGDSWASLTIRDGFNAVGSDSESGDLMLVNANDFLGDLTLGSTQEIINLDMLTALGGGDIIFKGILDGEDTGKDFTYLTGKGDDAVSVTVFGDTFDFAGSGLEIKTGEGDDSINVDFAMLEGSEDSTNEQLNQAVLDNVDIDGQGGDDVINVDGIGNANIDGGDGDDIIYTDGDANGGGNASWAFNFDNARVDDIGGTPINIAPEDLPGVQTSWAYLDGATVTVTLSGAGIATAAAGGGVMALPIDGAVQGDDGYEASFTITDLLGSNEYYGDQTDVNAAIIAAIEGDAVLNALLSASIAANNTLVITSKTTGAFEAEDIRIDIEHGQATDSSYANAVLEEARSLFNNSDYTLTDLWGTTTFATAAAYETDGSAPGAVFSDSVATNAWYDGLSVEGDTIATNSAEDNLRTEGDPSGSETDNVINGGNGDDVIVLSTDATFNEPLVYTPGGNNSMINGVSNETIVMEGEDFGDDTVMNFTTEDLLDRTGATEVIQEIVGVQVSNTDGGQPGGGTPEVFTLDVSSTGLEVSGSYAVTILGVQVLIPANADAGTDDENDIAAAIAAVFANTNVSGFTAVDNGDGTVTFTADDNGDVEISFANNFTAPANFLSNAVLVTADTGGTAPEAEDGTETLTNEIIVFDFSDATLANLDSDSQISFTVGGDVLAFDVTPGMSAEALAEAVADELNGIDGVTATFDGTQVTAEATGDGIAGNGLGIDETDLEITLIDGTVAGDIPLDDEIGGSDFLDFGAYLTSLEDISTNGAGSPDSDVSNNPIDVVLNYNEDNTLAGGSGDGSTNSEVEANEVAVVRMADDITEDETFENLTEADVAALFNSGAATSNFANLAASGFDVIDGQSDNAVVNGDGKAVFMVEDGDNLGHYKVFELSWDASADDGDEGVEANEIGSLDFGTSLTGLDDVNLVGSADYAALITDGILT